ncbi:MAG: DNA-processing protein DprA [Pseudomonadota bacterium]
MLDHDTQELLHLYHNFGPNSQTLIRLLDRFDHRVAEIRRLESARLKACGVDTRLIKKIRTSQSQRVELDLRWCEQPNHQIISYRHPLYPALLREIDDYPVILYIAGNTALMQTPQIAIVGSRNCTPGGRQHALEFAEQLCQSGLTITSGLAQGIDSHAHRGALSAPGNTIAVTGTGLKQCYPASNKNLFQEINASGLLISEYPPDQQARRHHFPERNRIISGLSLATLVIEATRRSGSLITARLAAEQGREVFALPGSVYNPQAQGCHQLIRDGARLIESPAEIIEEVSSLLGYLLEQTRLTPFEQPNQLDEAHRKLLETIGYDPISSDGILRRSGLTIDKLSSMLLTLELNDLIQSAPGGCYVRNNSRYP